MIYVYHTNVSEADDIYKNLPPNVISPIFLLLFLFRSGAPPMTLLTAGALTDRQLPATASNVCTTDTRLGGARRVPPPNKNPGYADGTMVLVHANTLPCQLVDLNMVPSRSIE